MISYLKGSSIKRYSTNGHSLLISMEQLARLCWAVSEAVVLAGGPQGI